MARAKYTYIIDREFSNTGQPVIAITDTGDHKIHKTVTNDIENVVEEISRTNGLDPKNCIIVYCDSGWPSLWDGWNAVTEKYALIEATRWEAAVTYWLSNPNARI